MEAVGDLLKIQAKGQFYRESLAYLRAVRIQKILEDHPKMSVSKAEIVASAQKERLDELKQHIQFWQDSEKAAYEIKLLLDSIEK